MKRVLIVICIFIIVVVAGCSEDIPVIVHEENFKVEDKHKAEGAKPTFIFEIQDEIQQNSLTPAPISQIVPGHTVKPAENNGEIEQPIQDLMSPKIPMPIQSVLPVKTPILTETPTYTPEKTPAPTKPVSIRTSVPAKTSTPKITPIPTKTPNPTIPSTTEIPYESIYDYPFNIEAIREASINVGLKMGFKLNSSFTPENASWWNPVIASQSNQGNILKKNLENYIRFHTIDNLKYYGIDIITDFNIYCESRGNGEYAIYFLFV